MNIRFISAIFLVALTGFIALSYEICWIRIYSFSSGSRAWVFGAMLGTYLIGLALGSLWSLKFQDAKDGSNPSHLRALSLFVLGANIFGFLVAPIISWIVPSASEWLVNADLVLILPLATLITLPLVGIAAALLGATLPLICHFAIRPDEKVGARLSYLYLANILGSGAGSLLTGFVLMDNLSMQGICVFLLVLGLLLSIGLAVYAQLKVKSLTIQAVTTLAIGTALAYNATLIFDGLYERLQWKHEYKEQGAFKMLIESRFGVITVGQDNKIYGGGVYDGTLSTKFTRDSWRVRPYFISAVHEAPKEILVIGLSGGTWTQILVNHPQVEKVTAVEINGAYKDKAIPQFDSTKSILTNPKLEIITDDGRRWLRMNKDRKFDVIVTNSTFYYREHATSLLSNEFMTQVNDHLKPGGICIFNTTGSGRSVKTAAEVFTDIHLLLNNVVASNAPIKLNKGNWRDALTAYEIDGTPVFDLQDEGRRSDLEHTLSILDNIDNPDVDIDQRLWSKEVALEHKGYNPLKTKDQRIITDDNLGHEFPHLPTLVSKFRQRLDARGRD